MSVRTRSSAWADNDMKDAPDGKNDPCKKIAETARVWKAQKPGRKVFIVWPPKGMDFNDAVKAGIAI